MTSSSYPSSRRPYSPRWVILTESIVTLVIWIAVLIIIFVQGPRPDLEYLIGAFWLIPGILSLISIRYDNSHAGLKAYVGLVGMLVGLGAVNGVILHSRGFGNLVMFLIYGNLVGLFIYIFGVRIRRKIWGEITPLDYLGLGLLVLIIAVFTFERRMPWYHLVAAGGILIGVIKLVEASKGAGRAKRLLGISNILFAAMLLWLFEFGGTSSIAGLIGIGGIAFTLIATFLARRSGQIDTSSKIESNSTPLSPSLMTTTPSLSIQENEAQYQRIMQGFLSARYTDGPPEGSLRICLLNNNHGYYDEQEAWFTANPSYAVRACEEALRDWNPEDWARQQLLDAIQLYGKMVQERKNRR